eukprot:3901027-Prymnesium_polylepis.1
MPVDCSGPGGGGGGGVKALPFEAARERARESQRAETPCQAEREARTTESPDAGTTLSHFSSSIL